MGRHLTHRCLVAQAAAASGRTGWRQPPPPQGIQKSAPVPWRQAEGWGSGRWPSPPATGPCSKCPTERSSESPVNALAASHRPAQHQIINRFADESTMYVHNWMGSVENELKDAIYMLDKYMLVKLLCFHFVKPIVLQLCRAPVLIPPLQTADIWKKRLFWPEPQHQLICASGAPTLLSARTPPNV